jgi:rhodanese-related sulfurtransferase
MSSLFDSAELSSAGHRDVTPAQVAAGGRGVRVVDVREPPELSGELGHIRGVEPVPLASVLVATQSWCKDDEIVLVCRSGARSGRAAAALAAAGFRRVMNMVGGMVAWNDAGLPVDRAGA